MSWDDAYNQLEQELGREPTIDEGNLGTSMSKRLSRRSRDFFISSSALDYVSNMR
jgi:hypothetical protein